MSEAPDTRLPPAHCAMCELHRQPAFKRAEPGDLQRAYCSRKEVVTVAAGQPILSEGIADHRLFTLYHGWAFRYQTLRDGSRQILNFLLPGDLIGLQAEFTHEYSYGVQALTHTSLCAFTVESMLALFRESPELAYDMTWRCASEERLVDENLVSAGARDALGLSLVHTNKRLRLLQQLGLFEIADGRLVIHDLETLAHVAQVEIRPMRKLRMV